MIALYKHRSQKYFAQLATQETDLTRDFKKQLKDALMSDKELFGIYNTIHRMENTTRKEFLNR